MRRRGLAANFAKKDEMSHERYFVQMVEIPGFEPRQTEPKSVVLPLHHISVPDRKYTKSFYFKVPLSVKITIFAILFSGRVEIGRQARLRI